MSDTTPKTWTCACGAEHAFGAWYAAHHREVLLHTCKECGAQHECFDYIVQPVTAASKLHPDIRPYLDSLREALHACGVQGVCEALALLCREWEAEEQMGDMERAAQAFEQFTY